MKAWQLVAGSNLEGLQLANLPGAPVGPRDVRVGLRAATLNFRDLMVARGLYPNMSREPLIPCSDGAGVVLETGTEVTRFKPGDRVTTCFFPHWTEGRGTRAKIGRALGGGGKGTLAEEIVLGEESLVASPEGLDFAQSAALTCAGVTAWNALFVTGSLRPGETVLLLGTGGVSIWALQLAKAAGARVILTSSSEEKAARARAMGADATINYRETPDWGREVQRLTGGEGADLIVEVGGEKTLEQSLASVRMGGTIIIVGARSGSGGGIGPRSLISTGARVLGVYVGSRALHEDLVRCVTANRIRPVIDRVFPFGEAPAAFREFETGRHFGKVAVTLGE